MNQLGHEADLSPSGGQIKNAWSYTSTPACVHSVVLNGTQGQFLPVPLTPSIPCTLKRPHRMRQYSMLYARPSVAMRMGGIVGWADSLVLDSHTLQTERCGTFALTMCLLTVKVGVGSISTSCP